MNQDKNKATNLPKNNKTASIKAPKPLTEAQLFFKDTVTKAIEVLDVPYVIIMKAIKENSVTRISRIVYIVDTLGQENVQIILRSKRPVDHVRNFFNPRQIDNLHGIKAILSLINLYKEIILRKEELDAEIAKKLAEQAAQEAAAAIPEKIAS